MDLSLEALLAIFSTYGYAIIFPIAVLEGPLVAIAGGLLVSRGLLNPFLVFGLLVLGDLVGDTIYYFLGRYGGRKLAHKWGAYIGVTEERVLTLEHYFHKNAWKVILFSKTQAVGSAILFSAGMAKMKYRRFIFWNGLGSIPKALLFQTIGYYFGQSTASENLNAYLDYAGIGSFFIALVLIGLYILIRRYAKKKALPEE